MGNNRKKKANKKPVEAAQSGVTAKEPEIQNQDQAAAAKAEQKAEVEKPAEGAKEAESSKAEDKNLILVEEKLEIKVGSVIALKETETKVKIGIKPEEKSNIQSGQTAEAKPHQKKNKQGKKPANVAEAKVEADITPAQAAKDEPKAPAIPEVEPEARTDQKKSKENKKAEVKCDQNVGETADEKADKKPDQKSEKLNAPRADKKTKSESESGKRTEGNAEQQVEQQADQKADPKASKMKKEKQKSDDPKSGDGGDKKATLKELSPPPAYIEHRIKLYDTLRAQYLAEIAAKPKNKIIVTLPDGKAVEGLSWESTPYTIACGISQGLADSTVIAKVGDKLWDLDRPLEGDCKLKLLKFDDPEAQAVFWHSSAHVLGEAMERCYGGKLCYGPPIENGFYYDMQHDGEGISQNDYKPMEDLVKKIVKEKQPFERLEMKKSDLLKMFEYNEFKHRILNEKVDTETTTVYRCGPLIDLCLGPHIRNTGKIKALKITKSSSSYWEGKADAEALQRVYGISFPDPKQLKEWEKLQEEAAKRDHRKIGREQELYFFHELSPGSCFFQPRGAHIYNTLINLIKGEYRKRGFSEVISPNIYNAKLWQTSGHWQHYAENMFSFDAEKETFALKPMNCPGHCLMFDHRIRSWRELPLRMADFGVLHRNELSGALTGLTRVRRFQQDDAHIFCTPEQIKSEITGCLNFLKHIYGIFGFTFDLVLSTRPEKFLGEIQVWNEAEKALSESLDEFGMKWSINAGDGAFYGPKIDITVKDALKRAFQCGTIQLDFQLPIRFNLNYVSETGDRKQPVMIHRAILGSVERMIAILTENCAGKWPFWLSPRQIMVVPVGPSLDEYASNVRDRLHSAGFMAEVDIDASDTMNKKIRNAQLAQFNYILVVGEKEKQAGTVNVRTRDNKIHGEVDFDGLVEKLNKIRSEFILDEEKF